MTGHTVLRGRAEELLGEIRKLVRGPVHLMELCGTHTMMISRLGLRARLPKSLRLLSGPGCPVCVTPCSEVDRVIALGRLDRVTLATFGDMLRVPGSSSSLELERAAGRDIRLVYSAMEALETARAEPERQVVFFGIGFETTTPTVAATLQQAKQSGVENFLVLPAFKLIPPAMKALLADEDASIDGFILPGHVSAIIGSRPYEPIAADYRIPSVVTGFEGLDILEGIAMLLRQLSEERAEVEIQYRRAVRPEGNPAAREVSATVLRIRDASWRGLGTIPGSGLELNEAYAGFDAVKRLPVLVEETADLPPGCACGEVLRGKILPPDCPLFGRGCDPARPVGSCMVSSEGGCAAWYQYERRGDQ